MIYLLTCKPNRGVYRKIIKTLDKSGREYKVYARKDIPPKLLMAAIQYGDEGIFTIVSRLKDDKLDSHLGNIRKKNYTMLVEMPLSRAIEFLVRDSYTRLLLKDNIIIDTDRKSVVSSFGEGWDAPFRNKKISEQLRMKYRARALEVTPLYSEDENSAGNGRKGPNQKKFDEDAYGKYLEYQKTYRKKNKERLKQYNAEYHAKRKGK